MSPMIKCGRNVTPSPHYHRDISAVRACYNGLNPEAFDRSGNPLRPLSATPSPTARPAAPRYVPPTATSATDRVFRLPATTTTSANSAATTPAHSPSRPFKDITEPQRRYYTDMITALHLPNRIADFDGWTISAELDRLKPLFLAYKRAFRAVTTAFDTPQAQAATPTSTAPDRTTPTYNRYNSTPAEDGVYKMDGKFYQVVTSPDTGRSCAKVFNPLTKRFRRSPGSVYRLTTSHRLSPSEAGDFGRLYGVCIYCSRTLTDDRSKGAGYGPVCAAKHNLPWGDETALTYRNNASNS